MDFRDQLFAKLAAQARAGDPAALAGLREELEPQMTHIVRRVVRTGAGNTPLARRILAEVALVVPAGNPRASADQEVLIGQVTRRLCAALAEQLQPPAAHPARETLMTR
jgi:hypothetical protein